MSSIKSSDDPGKTLQIDNVLSTNKLTSSVWIFIGPKAIIKNCGLKNCVVQSRVTLKDQNLENQIVFDPALKKLFSGLSTKKISF